MTSRPAESDAAALSAAYEAALFGPDGALLPACEALRKILSDACNADVPPAYLDLRGQTIGKGAHALAAVLKIDSYITFANLEETELGDDGVVAVAEALRSHPSIFRLDLGYNAISGKGLKAVAALLLDSTSLLCLDLSGNNLYSRLSLFAPSALSALAPLGRAVGSPQCKLQLLHLDQVLPSACPHPSASPGTRRTASAAWHTQAHASLT